MNLTFQHEFFYFREPIIPVTLLSSSGFSAPTEALIDTGADLSLFDERFATELGLQLSDLPWVNFSGVGGLLREARLAEVSLHLLDSPDLGATVEVAFAPDVELGVGNLIGLDVLEHFDFALSHRECLDYVGRSSS